MTSFSPRTRHGFFLLSASLLLSACGGSGDGADAQAEVPQDTLIKPMEREPLTEADLVGLDVASLALELPWTTNKVSRDAAAGAPAADLRGADVSGYDGFDRVTFTLGDASPGTGYEIAFAEAGATASCGADPQTLAGRALVVTFAPARAGADGERWIPLGVQRATATRMARAGLLCDDGSTVAWVAELVAGDQVRVLELRDPRRVAVDVR
ncbi:MAG: hypothetical protein AMXMBFR53_00190 [Gemmatimonadota bacterium]